jgi:hypothetical protein
VQHFPAAARRQNTAHSASCGKDEPDNAKPRRGERNATTKDNDEPLRSAARHSRIGSRHQNQPQKRTESPHEDDRADHLQHLHDLRMVRTPEIPRGPLYKVIVVSWVNRLLRILLPGPRKPHRLLRVLRGPTQNHPGSHYPHRLRRVLGDLSEAAPALELPGRLRPDCGSGRGDLQKVVRKRSMWRGPALSEVEGPPAREHCIVSKFNSREVKLDEAKPEGVRSERFNPGSACPAGTFENSPAFQRRVHRQAQNRVP